MVHAFSTRLFPYWHSSVLESPIRCISGGCYRFSHGIWDFNRIFMRLISLIVQIVNSGYWVRL